MLLDSLSLDYYDKKNLEYYMLLLFKNIMQKIKKKKDGHLARLNLDII